MFREIDERAWLFIEANAAAAGAGRISFAAAALDARLDRLAAQRIEHESPGSVARICWHRCSDRGRITSQPAPTIAGRRGSAPRRWHAGSRPLLDRSTVSTGMPQARPGRT
jgi:hypothetical protein